MIPSSEIVRRVLLKAWGNSYVTDANSIITMALRTAYERAEEKCLYEYYLGSFPYANNIKDIKERYSKL